MLSRPRRMRIDRDRAARSYCQRYGGPSGQPLGPVEGLNNKVRVILKRSYGLKSCKLGMTIERVRRLDKWINKP